MDFEKIREILTLVPDVIAAIVVAATVLVRVTPTKKDDTAVLAMGGKVWKAIQWLPTIGVNPQTKALKEAYEDAKAKLEALEKAVQDKQDAPIEEPKQ
jgi:hypothetical protein